MFWLFVSLHSWSQDIYSSMLVESWTGTAWQNSAQTMNTFDGNDFLANSLTQTWLLPTTEWQNAFQTNYTNNPDGTAAQTLSQTWNAGSGMWEDISRTTNTYSATDKLLQHVTEIWIGMWINSSQGINTYDGSDYLTTSLTQTWDFLGSVWNNSTQITFANNANGTVNQSIVQSWSGLWVNQSRSTFTYDGQNRVLTDLTETWSGSAWVNNSLDTYTYDGGGHLTLVLTQEWVGSAWQNDTQSLYTNNPDGSVAQIIGQSWNVAEGIWENETRITFTYNLAVAEFDKIGLRLSPNPAANYLTIRSEIDLSRQPYQISDDTGRVILSGKLNENETLLDVDQLQSGLYLVRIGALQKAVKVIKK